MAQLRLRKDLKDLAKQLEELGFVCKGKTNNNHLKWVRKDGKPGLLITPSTPSDWRGLKNALSTARKIAAQASEKGGGNA